MRMFMTALSAVTLTAVGCVDHQPDMSSTPLALTETVETEPVPEPDQLVEAINLVLPIAVLVPLPDPAGGETTTGLCIRSATRDAQTDDLESGRAAIGQVLTCMSQAELACGIHNGTGTFTWGPWTEPSWPTIVNTLDGIYGGSSCSYQFIGSTWLNNRKIIVTCSRSWTCVKKPPPT